MGVQRLSPRGSACGEFIRISPNQAWQLCIAAPSSIAFYSISGCRVTLYNFNGCADELDLWVVPSQSKLSLENQTIPDGMASQVRELVLSKLFRDYQAKQGKIDMNNDGNPNPQPNETGMIYTNTKTQ